MVRPGASCPVCIPVSPVATHCTIIRVRTWSSSASRPSELATWMRRWASAYETVTDVIASLSSRAAASARASSSTFLPFSTDLRQHGRRPAASDTAVPSSATVRVPLPVPRVAAAAAAAADRRPSAVRSAVCANPVVSPRTTRMPAPRSRPETSSSTRPSSYRALDERRSSTKTSAKSPPLRSASSRVDRRTSVSIIGYPSRLPPPLF